jgi:hypothetical protein
MDQAVPTGYLIAFGLGGGLLPIVSSFIVDGIVHALRGRGFRMLVISALLTIAVLLGAELAWMNGSADAVAATTAAFEPDSLDGAIQLLLIFSISASLIGLALRMLALFLNPTSKAKDAAAIQARATRRAVRAETAKARKSMAQAPSH